MADKTKRVKIAICDIVDCKEEADDWCRNCGKDCCLSHKFTWRYEADGVLYVICAPCHEIFIERFQREKTESRA